MAKIQVTFELDDDSEYADPVHPMGVTDEGYTEIVRALSSIGADDVNVMGADVKQAVLDPEGKHRG